MTFYWKFVDTLVHNIATISAIVVGVIQFFIRSFNENNGREKVRAATLQFMKFVDTLIEFGKAQLSPVEVVEQPQSARATVAKIRKRRSA
jgi:membrane-associated PAP2 superfamily phosphatase